MESQSQTSTSCYLDSTSELCPIGKEHSSESATAEGSPRSSGDVSCAHFVSLLHTVTVIEHLPHIAGQSLPASDMNATAGTPACLVDPGEGLSPYAYRFIHYSYNGDSKPSPRGRVALSFSQLSFNSLLLFPPVDAEDSRPLYHISVEMNCFKPGSWITVIRRGGSDKGAYVGEFE